ncbi:Zn-finger protein [Ceratobasidium sp. AG-Ba]|nr:Zn-finger protein [Ceratobasidium sp. AG-Ba]
MQREPGDIEDREGEGEGDDSDEEDDDDDDEENDEEAIEEEELDAVHEVIGAAQESLDLIAYPQPTLSVAVRPTFARQTGHHLASAYGAVDVVRSLARFLKPLARDTGVNPTVFLSDLFCHEPRT